MADAPTGYVKFYAKDEKRLCINTIPGHFVTSHSHVNFFVDVTTLKTKCSDAREAAKVILSRIRHNVAGVDVIVCLDNTEVLGGFLAYEIEKNDAYLRRYQDSIRIYTPEINSMNQLFFRSNVVPDIQGKNILLLLATTSTGKSVNRAIECVQYYGANVSGVVSLFSTVKNVNGVEVFSLFTDEDVIGYKAYNPHECPYCAKGMKIQAMVNGYGFSSIM